MQLLKYSHEQPSVNIALEEILLSPFVNDENAESLLRIWSNAEDCIVIGRAEEINKQVHLESAKEKGIPVIRRVSGGGTVIQGKGNLNISFFLPYAYLAGLENIKESYCLILKWVMSAIESCADVSVQINGTCDLVINDKKISGTAQARKRHGLLHHLTLLWDLDFELCSALLREPNKRPDYRSQRTHSDFITTFKREKLTFTQDDFIRSLCEQFENVEELKIEPEQIAKAQELSDKKYNNPEWNEER